MRRVLLLIVFIASAAVYAETSKFITLHKKIVFHQGVQHYIWPNSQETSDMIKFIEEMLNGKILFCAELYLFLRNTLDY